jgi:hypothetical protein
MTFIWVAEHIVGIGWLMVAWAFIIATCGGGLLIRKARARGKRLFVDLPMKRLGPPPTTHPNVDHRWDAL